MNVILAKSAGFCYGVRRSMDLVEEARGKYEGRIYTLGEIIHNETVISELAERDIVPVSIDDIDDLSPGPVIIRAHGVPKADEERLLSKGFEVIDATCPFVKRIHKSVYEHSVKGEHIIVLGNREHPEIKGILGYLNCENCTVISDKSEAEKFSLNKTIPVFLVAQTTFNHILFKECVEIIVQKGYDVVTLDTICSATYERQKEAEQIASKVDAMIVIGGLKSSNSKKLFDICKSKCDNTMFLQTKADFDPSVMQPIDNVGITAGASTPDKLIREVMMECQK